MVAFVLGNGLSRLDYDIEYLKRRGKVYACNAVFRTHEVDVLVATDLPIATEIQNTGYSKKNRFYTRRPLPEKGALSVPKEVFGFSSGPIAVKLSVLDGNNQIYLLGFDMGPKADGKFNNVYADTQYYKPSYAPQTYAGNCTRQLCSVINESNHVKFFRVHGETTENLSDFDTVLNLNKIDSETFKLRLNTGKDL